MTSASDAAKTTALALAFVTGHIPGMSSPPRRFGLTERQFVIILTLIGLSALAALGIWARSSWSGFIALYVIVGAGVAFTLIHRWRTGHWWDETR